MRDENSEQYDGSDDSEYHYSDDEMSESAGSASPKASAGGPKASFGSRLSSSKRMLISGVVFLVLVTVVYKMVAPSATSQAIDITPAVVAQKQKPAAVVASTAAPVSTPAPQSPMSQPVIAVAAPQPVAPAAPQPQAMSQPVQPQPVQPQSVQTVAVSQPVAQLPQQPPQQPIVTIQPMAAPQPAPTTAVPSQSVIDASIAAMTATENKLTSQMQTDYSQKLSAFEAQNKALQDQLQTLNSRLTSMETQMNQLVAALLKQNQVNATPASSPTTPASPQAQMETAPAPKIAYNVQAIIPGRAWLRSDNGETLTVAEGDQIKGAGRVTKIDPYDGVVEINTGNRVVSLSYGNGAA